MQDIFWFFAVFFKSWNHASCQNIPRVTLYGGQMWRWWRCTNGPSQIPTPKAQRFHRLVSDTQMQGRSSIYWWFISVKHHKTETDPSVTLYHPHLEGEGSETRGGENSRRVKTQADHHRGCVISNLIIRPFKWVFLASASQKLWKEFHLIGTSCVHTFSHFNRPFSSILSPIFFSHCSKSRNCTLSRSAWCPTSRLDLSPSAPFMVGIAMAGFCWDLSFG